jgi:DNA (cytosine-5)-methyltransferase 1
MKAIDLYAGIGGWTLGLGMAEIDVVKSYEWWSDANITHNKNFNLEHPTVDIRKLDVSSIPRVEAVVGSPPCTEFSFSNRGGSGDINEGIKDLYAFLEIVEHVQPKYWAMENVPRVAGILEKLISIGGALNRFAYLFKDIRVVNCADFGIPQNRLRMIAGSFPFHLFDSYKTRATRLTLGDVIKSLQSDPCTDPVYGIKLSRDEVTDHLVEETLSLEEERINRESKTYHPVYNLMNFPDRLDRPCRTVTALCTRVSRESIIIHDEETGYRRLTVRERGLIQSFPINFQFHSKSYGGKLKMIGNAIPPLLTYYIGMSMRGTPLAKVPSPSQAITRVRLGSEKALEISPEVPSRKFKSNRSFWAAIPHLRFGSGMRFDFKNSFSKGRHEASWSMRFFYGTSKEIKELTIDTHVTKSAVTVFNIVANSNLKLEFDKFAHEIGALDQNKIQQCWISSLHNDPHHPFNIVDQIGSFARKVIKELAQSKQQIAIFNYISHLFREPDGQVPTKILNNTIQIFSGIVAAGAFNALVSKKHQKMERPVVAA